MATPTILLTPDLGEAASIGQVSSLFGCSHTFSLSGVMRDGVRVLWRAFHFERASEGWHGSSSAILPTTTIIQADSERRFVNPVGELSEVKFFAGRYQRRLRVWLAERWPPAESAIFVQNKKKRAMVRIALNRPRAGTLLTDAAPDSLNGMPAGVLTASIADRQS